MHPDNDFIFLSLYTLNNPDLRVQHKISHSATFFPSGFRKAGNKLRTGGIQKPQRVDS